MSINLVALLGGSIALAQNWTYELTMERGPEPVDESVLRVQLKRMGVATEEADLEKAISKRKNGYISKTVTSYSRDGSRIEGHIRSLDGITLEFGVGRFMVDESGSFRYVSSKGAKGILEVLNPESYRSQFTLMEEELLMGNGKLADRVQALRTGSVAQEKFNPLDESFVATDKGIDVFQGKTLRYRVAYDEKKSELVIDKVVTPFKEKLIFREIETESVKRFEDFVPIGTPVTDNRIDETFPAQYLWKGKAPSEDELGQMNRDRGSRSSFPTLLVVSIGIFITGLVSLLAYGNHKRKNQQS